MSGSGAIDPWLLERLVCPVTRTPLRHDAAAGELVSDAAGLAYPIRDGVPVMLVEEARVLAPAQPSTGATSTDTAIDCAPDPSTTPSTGAISA